MPKDHGVPKHLNCPQCGSDHRMIVHHAGGYYECLRCDNEWYPRPRVSVKGEGAPYLGERIRAFLDMLRPFTLLGAGLAGFFLVLFSSLVGGFGFPIIKALAVGLILAALQGGSQCLNMSNKQEIKIDRENKKNYRPTIRGTIAPSEGKLWGLAVIGTAIGFSFALSIVFGLFAMVIAFFGYFYSYEPIKAKYHFLVSDFWQSFSRGSLPLLAVCYGLFGLDSLVPGALAVVMGFALASLQATKDFADVEGDSEFNVPTLPAKLGKVGAAKVMMILGVFAFSSLGMMMATGVLPLKFAWLFTLAVPTFGTHYSLKTGLTEYHLIENSVEWAFGFYATLAMWYALPPTILLIG